MITKKLSCVSCIKSGNTKHCVPPTNRRQICPKSGCKAKHLIHTDLLKVEISSPSCHTCGRSGLLCVICAERTVCRDCATFGGHPVCKHCLAEECDCLAEASLLYQSNLPLRPLIPGWSLLCHLKLSQGLKRLRAERITVEEFLSDQQMRMPVVLDYLKKTQEKVQSLEFGLVAHSIKSGVFLAIKSLAVSKWPAPAELLHAHIHPLIYRKFLYASRLFRHSNVLQDFCMRTIEGALKEAKIFRRQVFNLSDAKGRRFKGFERRWLRDGLVKSQLAKTWILCKYICHSRRQWRTTPPVFIH